MVMEGFVFVGVTMAFGLMAMQIFITFVEFYLVSLLALMLVPFGVFRHTAFLAEKALGGVAAFGIKVMVLVAITAAIQPLMETLRMTNKSPGLNELMSLFLGSWSLTLLAWHAPGVAAGMMAGSPTLTASTVAHTALAGAAGAGLAGVGTIGMGQLAAHGARRAVRYGSAALGAYQAGGLRGIAQTAGATVTYHANMLTAGLRGAAASGRIYGVNLSAVPWNPGSASNRAAASTINARLLAQRIVPPLAHPSGGVSAPLRHP